MDKLHNLRWNALKEDVLVWCVTHQPFHAWQQPVPSRHYSTIWCTWSEPPTGAGSQAVVENTLPRPGHVLHQWPRDPTSSHHSTTSELTPLYDQRAYTTLQPASSRHSMTSELTSLNDQQAHTSTTSELTPLYDSGTHSTLQTASSNHSMTSELTPLYDQRAHTILRLASSHHSTNSELTPLYDQ
ncbi:hypothetical protein EMCRGX_G004882 [Ephydatia muelleri]